MKTPVGIHHNAQHWKCWKFSAGYGLVLELWTVDLPEHTLELLLDFQHFSVGFPRMMAGFGRWNSKTFHRIPHIKFANLRAILCWKSRMPKLRLRESQHE